MKKLKWLYSSITLGYLILILMQVCLPAYAVIASKSQTRYQVNQHSIIEKKSQNLSSSTLLDQSNDSIQSTKKIDKSKSTFNNESTTNSSSKKSDTDDSVKNRTSVLQNNLHKIDPVAATGVPGLGSILMKKGNFMYLFGGALDVGKSSKLGKASDTIPNMYFKDLDGNTYSAFHTWNMSLGALSTSSSKIYDAGNNTEATIIKDSYKASGDGPGQVMKREYDTSLSSSETPDFHVVETLTPTNYGTVIFKIQVTNKTKKTIDTGYRQTLDTDIAHNGDNDDGVPIKFIGENQGLYIDTKNSNNSRLNKDPFRFYYYTNTKNPPTGWGGYRYDIRFFKNYSWNDKLMKDGTNTPNTNAYKEDLFGDGSMNAQWHKSLAPGETLVGDLELSVSPPGKKPDLSLDQSPKVLYSGGNLKLTGQVTDEDNVGQDEIIHYSINDGPAQTLTTVKNTGSNKVNTYVGTLSSSDIKSDDEIEVWAEDNDGLFSGVRKTILVTPPGSITNFTKKVKNVTKKETDFQDSTDADVGDDIVYTFDFTTSSASSVALEKGTLLKDVISPHLTSNSTMALTINGKDKGNVNFNSKTGELSFPEDIPAGSNVKLTLNATVKDDQLDTIPNTATISSQNYGEKNSNTANVNLIKNVNLDKLTQTITNLTTGEGANPSEKNQVNADVNQNIQYTFTAKLSGSANATVKGLSLVTHENLTSHTDASGQLGSAQDYKYRINNGPWTSVNGMTSTKDGVKLTLPSDVSVHGGDILKLEYTKPISQVPIRNRFIYNDGTLTGDNLIPKTKDSNTTKITHQVNDKVTMQHRMKKMLSSDDSKLGSPKLDLSLNTSKDNIFDVHSHQYGNFFEDYYDIKAANDNEQTATVVLDNYRYATYQNDGSTVAGKTAPIDIMTNVPAVAYLVKDGVPTKDISGSDLANNIINGKKLTLDKATGNLSQDLTPGTEVAIIIPRELSVITSNKSSIHRILETDSDIGGNLLTDQTDLDIVTGINKNEDNSNVIAPNFNKVTLKRPKTSSQLKQTVTNVSHTDWDSADKLSTKVKSGDRIHFDFSITAPSDNQDVIGLEGLKNLGNSHLKLVPNTLRWGENGDQTDNLMGSSFEKDFNDNQTVLNPNITTSIQPGETYHLSYDAIADYTKDGTIYVNKGVAVNANEWYPFINSNNSLNQLQSDRQTILKQEDIDEKVQSFNDTTLNSTGAHYTLTQTVKNVTTDSDYDNLQYAITGDTLRYKYMIKAFDLNQDEKMVGSLINQIKNFDDNNLNITNYQNGSLKVQYGDNGTPESLSDPSDLTKISLPHDIKSNENVYVTYDVKINDDLTVNNTITNTANFATTPAGVTKFNGTRVNITAISSFTQQQEVKNIDDSNSDWAKNTSAVPGETVAYRYTVKMNKIVSGRDKFNFSIHHIKQTPSDNMVLNPKTVKVQYYKPDGSLDTSFTGSITSDSKDSTDQMIDVGEYTYQSGSKLVVTYEMQTKTSLSDVVTNNADIIDDLLSHQNNENRYFAFNETKVKKQDKGKLIIRYIDADSGNSMTDILPQEVITGPIGRPLSEVRPNEQLVPKKIDGWTPVEQNTNDISNNADWYPIKKLDPLFNKDDTTIAIRYKKAMIGIMTPMVWNFGKYQPSSLGQTYYMKALRDDNNDSIPYGVSVFDYYQTENWTLKVEQVGSFKSDDGESLTGAGIRFKNANVQHIDGSNDQSDENYSPEVTNTDDFTLESDVPTTLMTYDKDERHYNVANDDDHYNIPGWGIWRYQLGTKKQDADYSVGVHVPEGVQPRQKHYTTTLRWTVSVAP